MEKSREGNHDDVRHYLNKNIKELEKRVIIGGHVSLIPLPFCSPLSIKSALTTLAQVSSPSFFLSRPWRPLSQVLSWGARLSCAGWLTILDLTGGGEGVMGLKNVNYGKPIHVVWSRCE
jgi:hypothetical protein